MTRIEQRDALAASMPAELRVIFDREMAAGNELRDFEIGRGDREGQTLLVMEYPFRAPRDSVSPGIYYREALDRDPMIFEYVTADGRWSLATFKLKPMKLTPLPELRNDGADDVQRVMQRQEAEASAPPAPPPSPSAVIPPPIVVPPPSPSADPVQRFLASLTLGFDQWHDGTGYDLDALSRVPATRRAGIEAMLLARRPIDWRDIEALAQFDTPTARAAVAAAVKSTDINLRRTASLYAPADAINPADREALLLRSLNTRDLADGLSQAIDEAADFHPPAVVEALLRGTLDRPGQTAVLFAALLFFIHGKADSPFDWAHRPFFLRFDGSDGVAAHHTAFRDLCTAIGVDPRAHGLNA